MDQGEEILEICDRHNRIIGRAFRETIHRLGLRHRAVHIFVFNTAAELYLQLRQQHKDQYPGHWDSSAAGHVSTGESYAAAAARELEEELGLREDLSQVAEVTACPETGWEHVVLFQCWTASTPTPNPEEIEQGAFYSLAEVDRMLTDPGLPVTPAFRLLYSLWKNCKRL
jgi:isopentenyl-diphosphate delta-isomerase